MVDLTLEQQLEQLEQQLAAKVNTQSEKLTDLTSEVLLERHTELKAERIAMPDTMPAQERASVTNKVKRIETVLKERGVEFEALPQANQQPSLKSMDNDQLLEEFARIEREYPTAPAGQKSSMTVRLKAMKLEVAQRLEQLRIAPATDPAQPDPEAEGPTDQELTEVETATATATVEEAPKRNRRRS